MHISITHISKDSLLQTQVLILVFFGSQGLCLDGCPADLAIWCILDIVDNILQVVLFFYLAHFGFFKLSRIFSPQEGRFCFYSL